MYDWGPCEIPAPTLPPRTTNSDPTGCLVQLEQRVAALEQGHADMTQSIRALDDSFFCLAERLDRVAERSTAGDAGASTEFVQGVTSRLGVVYDAVEDLESFLLNR